MEALIPTSWWLGYWRAGERLYWWTCAVSPVAAAPQEVVRAVRSRTSSEAWQDVAWGAALSTADQEAPDPAAEAAFVSAGSLLWDDIHPLIGRLTSALPASVSASGDARMRRLRERMEELADEVVPAEELPGVVAERIKVRLDLARLDRQEFDASLIRAWTGPLVDPQTNRDLFGRLGALLIPPVLRSYLASFDSARIADATDPVVTTVTVASGPELGVLPWELLSVDRDTRLLEVARVRGGISPASLVDLARPAAPDVPDGPVLRILDPTRGGHVRDAAPIYPRGLPAAWAARQRGVDSGVPAETERDQAADDLSDLPTTEEAGCTREEFGERLREQTWARLLFLGHVDSGDTLSPTTSALRFDTEPTGRRAQPLRSEDGRLLEEEEGVHALSARVWLHAPDRWPMPRRVALIACQADDSRYVEQAGLTLAAVNAGARIVTTTRWTCPTDQSVRVVGDRVTSGRGATTALALAVDDAHAQTDVVAALRVWQCDELRAWRTADSASERRRHAPLLWAAPVTYVLPDTVPVSADIPDD